MVGSVRSVATVWCMVKCEVRRVKSLTAVKARARRFRRMAYSVPVSIPVSCVHSSVAVVRTVRHMLDMCVTGWMAMDLPLRDH